MEVKQRTPEQERRDIEVVLNACNVLLVQARFEIEHAGNQIAGAIWNLVGATLADKARLLKGRYDELGVGIMIVDRIPDGIPKPGA